MVGWIGPADLKSWKNNVHASSNVSLNSPITESLTKYLHNRSFVWRTVFLPSQSSVSPRINVQSHQHMGRTQRQTMKPELDRKYSTSGPSHQQCHFACYAWVLSIIRHMDNLKQMSSTTHVFWVVCFHTAVVDSSTPEFLLSFASYAKEYSVMQRTDPKYQIFDIVPVE